MAAVFREDKVVEEEEVAIAPPASDGRGAAADAALLP